MAFVAAVCPQCSGALQLPDDRDVVKCMYCTTDIVVRQAIQLIPGNSKNFLELAENAVAAANFTEAYGYATRVLEIEPNNSDAWFIKGQAAGWQSRLVEFRFAEMLVAFQNARTYAGTEQKELIVKACANTLNEVATQCYAMARKHMLEYVALPNTWIEYLPRCSQVISLMAVAHEYRPDDVQIIENIVHVAKDNIEGVRYNDPYDNNIAKTVFLSDAYEKEMREVLETYSRKVRELKPDYVTPTPKRPSTGCFVVTATMGDEMHPAVELLRAFRDESLSKYALGRVFIDWYYVHGPALAHQVAKSTGRRKATYFFLVAPAVVLVKALKRIGK